MGEVRAVGARGDENQVYVCNGNGNGNVLLASISFVLLTLASVWVTCLYLNTPTLYVQDLYLQIQPLNNSPSNSTSTSNVFIHLKFERSRAIYDYDYADTQVTLFTGKDPLVPVGVHVVKAFHLGGRKIDVNAVVEAPGLSTSAVSELVVQLVVTRRLWLCYTSSFTRKDCGWWDYRYPDVVSAYVALDASAHKLSITPIKFTS